MASCDTDSERRGSDEIVVKYILLITTFMTLKEEMIVKLALNCR